MDLGGPSDAGPIFRWSSRREDGMVTMVLVGELDLESAPEFAQAARNLLNETAHLVLDLTSLSFIDSSGLRELWVLSQTAQKEGASVRLANVPESVGRVLRVSGTLRLFAYAEGAGPGDQPGEDEVPRGGLLRRLFGR